MNSGFTTNHQFYTYIPSTTSSTTTNKLILFLHGLGSTQNYYYSLIPHFPNFNILLIDHEGAGLSQLLHLPLHLTLQHLSNNIIIALQELTLIDQEIILVGHSMSGMLVNYMNNFCPQLSIIKNILISPVHSSDNLNTAIKGRIDQLEATKTMVNLANTIPEAATGENCTGLKKAFIRQLILGNSIEGYSANCQAIISGGDYSIDYGKISIPTLLVYGKYDKTSPWIGCIEEIAKGLGENGVLKELPVGHWIAIEDDVGLAEIMKQFV